MNKKPRAVILAAGKGTRMKSNLPKVLHKVGGKTLLVHVLENLHNAGIFRPIIIIGYGAEEVKINTLQNFDFPVDFCIQKEQLGTGHAVLMTKEMLENFKGEVIIASGDVPLLSSSTFRYLLETNEKDSNCVLSLITMLLDQPRHYGRIIRDKNQKIKQIIEYKDADTEIKKIKEVNTGTYCIKSNYLFEALGQIDNDNASGEYYLPDIIKILYDKKLLMNNIILENQHESLGVNTLQELKIVENYIQKN
jgi:bifunctional UDP-N-acetylglucosamine pyrophosphorylase/glucosamine-1-phosphate N-acetyltransferase